MEVTVKSQSPRGVAPKKRCEHNKHDAGNTLRKVLISVPELGSERETDSGENDRAYGDRRKQRNQRQWHSRKRNADPKGIKTNRGAGGN
jgi:hypothetical protein